MFGSESRGVALIALAVIVSSHSQTVFVWRPVLIGPSFPVSFVFVFCPTFIRIHRKLKHKLLVSLSFKLLTWSNILVKHLKEWRCICFYLQTRICGGCLEIHVPEMQQNISVKNILFIYFVVCLIGTDTRTRSRQSDACITVYTV